MTTGMPQTLKSFAEIVASAGRTKEQNLCHKQSSSLKVKHEIRYIFLISF